MVRRGCGGAAIALMLASLGNAASAQTTVTVVEYYNRALDAYFITGRASEKTTLDGIADFSRTGMTFQAISASGAPATHTPICRFYIRLNDPFTSSHFYGLDRSGGDCDLLRGLNPVGFTYEGLDFAVRAPVGGVCPADVPVAIRRGFRAASGGKTPNHRYTVDAPSAAAAAAAGFADEGLQFCVASATPPSSPPPSSSGDCSMIFESSATIDYRQTSTGASSSTTTLTRTVSTTPTTYAGRPISLRIRDASSPSDFSETYYENTATAWNEVGVRSVAPSSTVDLTYSPPLGYPKSWATGQTVNFTRTINQSPAQPTGPGSQTGTLRFVGREDVTVPAGTYRNACKFESESTVTYSGIGSTTRTNSTSWLVPGTGMVKSTVRQQTTVFSITTTSDTEMVATAVR